MRNVSEAVENARAPGAGGSDADAGQVYAEARRKALEWMGERYLLASPVTRFDHGPGLVERED